MSRKRRLRALLPAMAMLLALDLTVSAGMLTNADTLDLMFGKGYALNRMGVAGLSGMNTGK